MLKRTLAVSGVALAFACSAGSALACHGEGSRGEAAASLIAFRTVGATHAVAHHAKRTLVVRYIAADRR